jgi:hypothetical protein
MWGLPRVIAVAVVGGLVPLTPLTEGELSPRRRIYGKNITLDRAASAKRILIDTVSAALSPCVQAGA